VRWRDEVGRAGTRVGRRVDKKAAVLFHLCLIFFSLLLIFPLLSASFFSSCPGFWFSRARAYIRPPSCGAEVSLRFFGLINIQQADKTEKFKVEIQL